MNSHRTIQISLVATALLGATVFTAMAGTPHDELPAIKAALASSRISLSQATLLAEAAGSGKAVHAKLSTAPARAAYDVEVLTGESLLNIKIDSRTGALISSSRDTPDRDADDANDDEQTD